MTPAGVAGNDHETGATDSDDPRTGVTGLRSVSLPPTRVELIARLAEMRCRAESLPEIEQAKGALMLTYGLSADAAFALLRHYSQNRNVKVRDIAVRLTKDLVGITPDTVAAFRMDRLLDDVTTSEPSIRGSPVEGVTEGATEAVAEAVTVDEAVTADAAEPQPSGSVRTAAR